MTEMLKLTLPGHPDYISVVKIAIGVAGRRQNLNIEEIHDLQTAVVEGCRLVTCHQFEKWSNSYDITLNCDEKQLIIEIRDVSGVHDIEKVNEKKCLCCPDEGNVGLNVIQYIIDEVKIEKVDKGCKSIKLIKNLK